MRDAIDAEEIILGKINNFHLSSFHYLAPHILISYIIKIKIKHTKDRWTVVFHSDDNKELDDNKRQLSIAVNVNQANTNEDNTEIYVMNNYFGIGIDADVCLDFHTAREENPTKFNSR